MDNVKIKISIPKDTVQSIIDIFIDRLKKKKELRDVIYKSDYNSGLILNVASTSDHLNHNARIIDGNFVEKNLEKFIGAPMRLDHAKSHLNTVGFIFDAFVYEYNGKKLTIVASIVNLEKLDLNLSDYSRISFSTGYDPVNDENICPSCKQMHVKFIHWKTHNAICCHCDHNFGKIYDMSKVKLGPHLNVWAKFGQEYLPTSDQNLLKLSHGVKSSSYKNPPDFYYMLIQTEKVKEVSIVDRPADGIGSPMLSFKKVCSILDSDIFTESSNDPRGRGVYPKYDFVEDSLITFSNKNADLLNLMPQVVEYINDEQILNEYKQIILGETNMDPKDFKENLLSIIQTIQSKSPKSTPALFNNIDDSVMKGKILDGMSDGLLTETVKLSIDNFVKENVDAVTAMSDMNDELKLQVSDLTTKLLAAEESLKKFNDGILEQTPPNTANPELNGNPANTPPPARTTQRPSLK